MSDLEKQNYGFLLSWFESWRVWQRLEPDRAAAVEFWKAQVVVKLRKEWQIERWGDAVRWYLRWLQWECRCAFRLTYQAGMERG